MCVCVCVCVCVCARVCVCVCVCVCAQDIRAMLLSTKSPFSVIIYNLNLPVRAETRSPDDYYFISDKVSFNTTL